MTTDDNWLTFQDMLKGYRKDTGMSVGKFSNAIGYSQAYVSKVELGRRKPSLQFVETFISTMGMSKSEGAIWHRLAAKANGWKV